MSLNRTPSRNGRALCVPGGSSTAMLISRPLNSSIPPVLRPETYMPPFVQWTVFRCSLLSMSGPSSLSGSKAPGDEAELLP